MIVVKIMGGLGNQLFQYAFGMALAEKNKINVRYDLSFFDDQLERHDYTPRKLSLSSFGLEIAEITKLELINFQRVINPITFYDKVYKLLSRKKYHIENGPHYESEVSNLKNNTYCEGYFQDERYFANISRKIRLIFTIKSEDIETNEEILKLNNEIVSSESICIHIRRGDYITNPINYKIFGELSKEFYLKAINHIESKTKSKTKKFLFSNDIEWCKRTFSENQDITIVNNKLSGLNGITHFWLMSKCKHFVIANSSFSWWAAWLADYPNKIICRPDPWFINKDFIQADVCPDDWVKITRTV